MSRKGKSPITLPAGVEVTLKDNNVVVKSAKVTLKQELLGDYELEIEGGKLLVKALSDNDDTSRLHGLARALVSNMIVGASQGFTKKLELVGVGYRATVQGKKLDLQLGFSHPTQLDIPEGITVAVEKNTIITITGYDKQKVGQFAANVRALKKPEPYQGKGVRYSDEVVRRKAGKAGKSGKK